MRRSTIVVAILAATVASAEASPKSERLAAGASVPSRSHTTPNSTAGASAKSKQIVNAGVARPVPAVAPIGAAAFTSARTAGQAPAPTAASQAIAQTAPVRTATRPARTASVGARRGGQRMAMNRQDARRVAVGSRPQATDTDGAIVSAAPAVKAGPAADAPTGSIPAMVTAEARRQGVSPALAHAVVKVESRYQPNVTGHGGYVGLMQISYQTARGMGFQGSRAALYQPSNNLTYGMRYLAEAVRLSGGNTCAAVSKYQGGHAVKGVTRAGAVYCAKVRRFMAEGVPSGGAQVASN